MPAKTQHKTIARGTRKIAVQRNGGQTSACKGRESEADNSTIIADSIHSLKVKEKGGTEVFFKQDKNQIDKSEFNKVVEDLWQCNCHARKLLNKEKTDFRPDNNVRSMDINLGITIDTFKILLPADFDFNIERDQKTGKYFFVIYRVCDSGRWWHTVEIGATLLKLAKENKRLHDFFILFIATFCKQTGVDLWFTGYMGSSIDMMEDNILNWEPEAEPDEITKAKETYEFYKKGTAKKYQQLIWKHIRKKKLPTAKQLTRRCRYYREHPIIDVIYQGCILIESGLTVYNFQYDANGVYGDSYYLPFDCQANFVWDSTDFFTRCYSDYMDADAQEGVEEPILNVRIDNKTKELNFEKLLKQSEWSQQLSDYLTRADDMLKTYTYERVNIRVNANV